MGGAMGSGAIAEPHVGTRLFLGSLMPVNLLYLCPWTHSSRLRSAQKHDKI
jgi:hypothetical protein